MHTRQDGMIDGILLVYHHPPYSNAPTILEHVHMFAQHSQFAVCEINTEYGFPPELRERRFRIVLLHYSLFGGFPYQLNDAWREYLRQCEGSYKIAFFQDEYYRCPDRFDFIREQQIDCIYSLLRPHLARKVYGRNAPVPRLRYTIPSYVSDEMVAAARCLVRPSESRPIDVGYRARPTYYHMGIGAREKTEIARRFKQATQSLGLKLDIETDEHHRIYGDAWPRFLSNCKAVLGVEAGVSIFDVTDGARRACEAWLAKHPTATFEEVHQAVLQPWENRLYYRTIGPRHFEAAALRTCQILFEGDYSGILKPGVHYIPLKKDFSNIDEVLQTFRDTSARDEMTEAAYEDLIASGDYSCKRFVETFDRDLIEQGIFPCARPSAVVEVVAELHAAVERQQQRQRFRQWRLRVRRRIVQFLTTHQQRFVLRPARSLARRTRDGVQRTWGLIRRLPGGLRRRLLAILQRQRNVPAQQAAEPPRGTSQIAPTRVDKPRAPTRPTFACAGRSHEPMHEESAPLAMGQKSGQAP